MKLSFPKIGRKQTALPKQAESQQLDSSLSVDNDFLDNDITMVDPFNSTGGATIETDLSGVGSFQPGQTEPVNISADDTIETVPQDQDLELIAADYKLKIKRGLSELGGKLTESYSMIVFQAGSFGLRGALIKDTRHEAKVAAVATSSSVDFTRSIAEVIAKFKASHKRLPKRAILITPSVATNLIHLAVSPLRPRSPDQMEELIRWELEGAITQQNVQWKVGSILVERGHMTANQRNNVLEELEIRQAQGGPMSLTRFGDLAVQLGYVTREHLEECFALQGKLVAVDDALEYGWQASEVSSDVPSDEALLSQEDDSDSSHPWLVSGMSKTIRRRWLGAFNLNGLVLEAFYPIVSSGFASLAQRLSKQAYLDSQKGINASDEYEKQWLLEIYTDQLALISGNQSIVTNIDTFVRRGSELTLAECLEFLEDKPLNVKRLFVACHGNEEIHALMPQLAEALNVEVQLLSMGNAEMGLEAGLREDMLLGVHGVANHFLGHMPAKRLSRISAREVKENVWKNQFTPKKIAQASIVVIVIAMFSFLGWVHWNTQYNTQRLADLNAKYDQEMALKQQLQSAYGQSLSIQNSIEDARVKIKDLDVLLKQQEANATYRREATKSILKVISLALNSGVSVTEVSKQGDQFKVTALALTNLEGQEFVAAIDRLSKPLRYQVSNSKVASENNGVFQVVLHLNYNASLSKDFEAKLAGVR